MKLLREPLVQFMFIGAFIYLLYGVFAEPVAEETDKSEELNKQFYASLRDQYTVVIEEPEQKEKIATLKDQAQ